MGANVPVDLAVQLVQRRLRAEVRGQRDLQQ